jgi:hypothetical protein
VSATSKLEAKQRREVRIRNKVTRREPLTAGEAAVLVASLDSAREKLAANEKFLAELEFDAKLARLGETE